MARSLADQPVRRLHGGRGGVLIRHGWRLEDEREPEDESYDKEWKTTDRGRKREKRGEEGDQRGREMCYGS